MTDARWPLICAWAEHHLGPGADIRPLAGDASFRRYFRVSDARGDSWVLMDAPPEHEDVAPFLAVRGWLEHAGLRVPALRAEERENGLLLLEDFGDRTWAGFRAEGGELHPLFEDALHQLRLLQTAEPEMELPRFDVPRMQRECDLYLDWYLPRVAGYSPTGAERRAFHQALLPHLQALAGLPAVPVHLDYHSRNLMLPPDGLPLGIIDFQDAVIGPPTYDLASLLYDCYQDYPEEERRRWSQGFFQTLPKSIAQDFAGFEHWHRMLRLTALQRHIKAIGIFARLAHRDGKRQFLDEIPLTRSHLLEELEWLGIAREAMPLLWIGPDNACRNPRGA